MEIHIYKDANQLSIAVAEWMIEYINSVLKKQDRFTIALSGGSTPQKLHEVLASSAYKEKINWSKFHIFFGDERAVPFEDERNNARMAYDTLLNHLPVPSEQIHIMRTDIDPERAVKEYEKILHQYFDNSAFSFDLVLLGMGDDGHTLSLFPGAPILNAKGGWVKTFYLSAQNMFRITLTAEIVNRAAAIAFLVTGKNKAKTLKEVLRGSYQPQLFPSQFIKPVNGDLHWFIDEQAAAEIK